MNEVRIIPCNFATDDQLHYEETRRLSLIDDKPEWHERTARIQHILYVSQRHIQEKIAQDQRASADKASRL
jgi:hypothetical protein